jgi:hypothetical protein
LEPGVIIFFFFVFSVRLVRPLVVIIISKKDMKRFEILCGILGLTAFTGIVAGSLPPIQINGSAFYAQGSSERFYIRGVDYQPGGSSEASDPLADENGCTRDIKFFTDLGLNAIRVYTVDNTQNHSACMNALDAAGIYVLLDVNTPKNSLNRADPGPSYNGAYLQTIFATIDAFKDFDNVLGFFAANEVINSPNTTTSAPYVKAVVRDMKQYIKDQASRQIPVGYSAADIATNRWQQMEFFNCGDEDERIDMFGMNDYEWCGDSSFATSGYQANVEQYGNYSIPMFFSEYGCNNVLPRTFTEVATIYSDEMSPVYSGGLVYEYSNEGNNYGLVNISGDTVTTTTDYDNFKKALQNAKNPSGDGGASGGRQAASCPSSQSGLWEVQGTTIPDTPSNADQYFSKGAGTPLGTNAPWTQDGDNTDESAGGGTTLTGSPTGSTSTSSASHSKSAAAPLQLPYIWQVPLILPITLLTAGFTIGLFI